MNHDSSIADRAILACGLGFLLLCCAAGCAGHRQEQSREAMACDPYYGFRPTRWHAWPYCPCAPETDQLITVEERLKSDDQQTIPIDPPTHAETVPTPPPNTLGPDKPLVPAPPEPGLNGEPSTRRAPVGPTFPSVCNTHRIVQEGWPNDVAGGYWVLRPGCLR